MIKLFATLCLMLAWSQETTPNLSLQDTSLRIKNSSLGTNLLLDTEKGSSETETIKAYVPIGGGSASNYNVLGSGVVPNNTDDAPVLGLYLKLENAESKKVQIAVQSGTVYKQLKVGEDSATVTSRSLEWNQGDKKWVYFSLTELCSLSGGSCDYPSFSSSVTKSLFIYAFSHTDDLQSDIDPESEGYNRGVYFKVFLSSLFTTEAPEIISISRGDAQVKASLNRDSLSIFDEGVDRLLTIQYSSLAPQGSNSYLSATALGTISEEEYADQESVKIKGLVNGEMVNVAFAYVNRFQYVTAFTPSELVTPEEIEGFIEKQACFLFSAGFQKNHFVLDGLRNFRDSVLMENFAGRMFVSWYYKTAPAYTAFIYNNSFVSFLIRCAGYVLYFCIQFWYLFIFPAIFFIYRFKQKVFS